MIATYPSLCFSLFLFVFLWLFVFLSLSKRASFSTLLFRCHSLYLLSLLLVYIFVLPLYHSLTISPSVPPLISLTLSVLVCLSQFVLSLSASVSLGFIFHFVLQLF